MYVVLLHSILSHVLLCIVFALGGTEATVVAMSICSSKLWMDELSKKRYRLTAMLRLCNAPDRNLAEDYHVVCMAIGDGLAQRVSDDFPDYVKLPDYVCLPYNSALTDLIDSIYPSDVDYSNSCILAPYNSDVAAINALAIKRIPGELLTSYSKDYVDGLKVIDCITFIF